MANEQACYERDFLTNVVIRVDFSNCPVVTNDALPGFTKQIADRYPHASGLPMRDLTINVTEAGADMKHLDRGFLWTHTKEIEGTVNVSLGPDHVALSYGPADYKGFADLVAEFTYLLDALHATAKVPEFSRIGLRYVNEVRLRGKALDWDGIIAPDLVNATLTRPLAGGRLQRSMHQICELHDEDQVLLSYGLFNADYPEPLVQRHFILDVDCSRSGATGPNDAIACIHTLNRLASNTFERSIADELRNIMGRKNV